MPQYRLFVVSGNPAAVVATSDNLTCLYFALYTLVTPLFAKSGAATERRYSNAVLQVLGSSVVQRISKGIEIFSPQLFNVSSATSLSIPSNAPFESTGFAARRFR